MRITAALLLTTFCLGGCNAPDDPSSDSLLSSEATLALAKAPALEHGALWFGARVETDFSVQPLHAWSFELAKPATVRLATEGSATGPDLDTILYLYRHGNAGWGSYLARNDDAPESRFSRLERLLAPGRYRVLVRGPKAEGNSFVLAAWCDGAGCNAPVQPAGCALGEKLADVSGLLSLSTIITLQGRVTGPDAWLPRQLAAAAQHAPLRRVETAAQLFQQADSGLVRWFRVWDYFAGRDFRVVEFKLDGRSYGAVFPPKSVEPVAVVDGGRLQQCRVPVVRCVLGTTYRELRDNPRYALRESRVVTSTDLNTLQPLEQRQLLSAVQVAYEDVTDLAAALASVDQGEVNQLRFTPIAGGSELVAYEYGAGDNSYGGVFEQDSSELAARINDGDLIECKLLE